MGGIIFFAVVLLGISIHSWYLVFNETARRKSYRWHWRWHWRKPSMSEDEKAMAEGGSLAMLVLRGTISAVLLLFLIFLGIYQLFSPA